MKEIREIVGEYPRLKTSKVKEKLALDFCTSQGIEFPSVTEGTLLGLEVEVEGVKVCPDGLILWDSDVDNSLKDRGMEFKSIPIRSDYAGVALAVLKHQLDLATPGYYCGPRAAFHYHLNVRDLTLHQLCVMCLMYSTVEWILFSLVNENRKTSNFCVPVNETDCFYTALDNLMGIPNPTMLDLESFVEDVGGKYSAFGMFRLLDLGTVEFRHMESTFDVGRLAKWIELGVNLKAASKRITLSTFKKMIYNINTTSHYDLYVKTILGVDASAFPGWDNKLISYAISNVKRVFTRNIEIPFTKLIESPLGKRLLERIL